MFLLNDLQISLKLGEYEFGAAKPHDLRTKQSPFSRLTMHDEALADYHSRSHPLYNHETRQTVSRPQTAFKISHTRDTSRLELALMRRPKTAPSRLLATEMKKSSGPLRSQTAAGNGSGVRCDGVTGRDGGAMYFPDDAPAVRFEEGSDLSTPRTYRSLTPTESETKPRISSANTLEKYYQRQSGDSRLSSRGRQHGTQSRQHYCGTPGPFDFHRNSNTTTVGPNSAVHSLIKARPISMGKPCHQSAWYHKPHHYPTMQNPNVSLRVYAKRKIRTSQQQKSAMSPIKSRFLRINDNTIETPSESGYIVHVT